MWPRKPTPTTRQLQDVGQFLEEDVTCDDSTFIKIDDLLRRYYESGNDVRLDYRTFLAALRRLKSTFVYKNAGNSVLLCHVFKPLP
jgi:hypothetical protein